MGPVVVARASGEGQAPGHRQGTVRVVIGQPELGGGDLHRRGEARIEVDMADLVDGGAGQSKGCSPGQPDCRGRVEVGAVGEEPVVLGIGASQREDPAVTGHTGGLRRSGRTQDDGCPLVDLEVRRQQLGVGIADHPVGLGDRRQLLSCHRLAQPGVGIGGCHLGKAGPEPADVGLVLGQGPARLSPHCVLEQREDVDREVEAPLLL